MAYRYVAQTRIRASFRHWRLGLVEVSAEVGDELDYSDPGVAYVVDEALIPSGAVARKRGDASADTDSEE